LDAARIEPQDPCDAIALELAESGWCIHDQFLDAALTGHLVRECRMLWQQGALERAGVGPGGSPLVLDSVRGDHVRWIDPLNPTLAQRAWLDQLERLRLVLNRQLFLGLFEYEGHLATYPPGAYYRRHLDSFQGRNQRRISIIYYLNTHWRPVDGGQLRLYLGNEGLAVNAGPGELAEHGAANGAAHVIEPSIDIAPLAGRLVVFLSERFEHEVLPAMSPRMSLAGWYRTRSPMP